MIQLTEFDYNKLKKGHDLYEKIRKLNPRQFNSLWRSSMNCEVPFDDLLSVCDVSKLK